MFTGIIEEIGTIKSISKAKDIIILKISAEKILSDAAIGDSIAVDGTCLTVTQFSGNEFTVDVSPETYDVTALKNRKNGDQVNLERALAVGARLGGHFVSGHIDGIGTIKQITPQGNSFIYSFSASDAIMQYIIHKGSVSIDGISLTIAAVDSNSFSVAVIPHTVKETTLKNKKAGDVVNIENDMLGKYIKKFMAPNEGNKKNSSIDLEFLRRNNFM